MKIMVFLKLQISLSCFIHHEWNRMDYLITSFPANTYMFKINNRNTREKCELRSKAAIEIPERHH